MLSDDKTDNWMVKIFKQTSSFFSHNKVIITLYCIIMIATPQVYFLICIPLIFLGYHSVILLLCLILYLSVCISSHNQSTAYVETLFLFCNLRSHFPGRENCENQFFGKSLMLSLNLVDTVIHSWTVQDYMIWRMILKVLLLKRHIDDNDYIPESSETPFFHWYYFSSC